MADVEFQWAAGGPAICFQLSSSPPSPVAERTHDQSTVFVLRRAPRGLLSELRHAGHNFVDVSRGIVRLAFPNMLIDRSDLGPPPRTTDPRRLRDPFADRASLVARTLFRYPDRYWKTRELAQAAGVSPMLASHVVRQLVEYGVVDDARHGREARIRLRSERLLVELWSRYYDWRKNPSVAFAAPVGDPARFVQRLPRALDKHRWMLTIQAGASLVAPHATWDKIHIYVDVASPRDLHAVGAAVGWAPDLAGQVILMQPWYHDAVWTDLVLMKKVPVAGILQLIIDLWDYPVRGREQAERLLEAHLTQRKRVARGS